MNAAELKSLVQRVVGRALAERGLQRSPHPDRSAPAPWVHVELHGAEIPPRPQSAPAGGAPGLSPTGGGGWLVTAECLAQADANGRLHVPAGSIVTPAAEDEAWRRGISIVRGPGEARVPARARRVAIGCDHGGYELKLAVLDFAKECGWQTLDLGTHSSAACDYPDFALAVAESVATGRCELGIAIDGAGLGSAMAANKVPGVRAAPCTSVELAKNAREHNFANVLTLGAKALAPGLAQQIVRAFLSTPTGEARHARRIAKIDAIEARYARHPHIPAPRH